MPVVNEPLYESVITQEMRDAIGVESAVTTYEVTSTNVRMFARAVGYDDPIYYDRKEAQRRGFRDLPAPPGFFGTPAFDPKTSNPTFGTTRGSQPWARSPYTLILNGGTDVEYMHQTVVAGEELTAGINAGTPHRALQRGVGWANAHPNPRHDLSQFWEPGHCRCAVNEYLLRAKDGRTRGRRACAERRRRGQWTATRWLSRFTLRM